MFGRLPPTTPQCLDVQHRIALSEIINRAMLQSTRWQSRLWKLIGHGGQQAAKKWTYINIYGQVNCNMKKWNSMVCLAIQLYYQMSQPPQWTRPASGTHQVLYFLLKQSSFIILFLILVILGSSSPSSHLESSCAWNLCSTREEWQAIWHLCQKKRWNIWRAPKSPRRRKECGRDRE